MLFIVDRRSIFKRKVNITKDNLLIKIGWKKRRKIVLKRKYINFIIIYSRELIGIIKGIRGLRKLNKIMVLK